MKSATLGKGRRMFVWRAIVPAFSIAAILMVIVLSSLPDTTPVTRRAETQSAPAAVRKPIRNHTPQRTPRVNRDPVVSNSTATTLIDTSVPQTIGTTEPATPNVDHRNTTTHGEEPIVTGGRRP